MNFCGAKIYGTLWTKLLKSSDFAYKLRYARCGSHVEAMHASATNRQIISKNRPLNTAGYLGGDNKVTPYIGIRR